VRDLVVERLDPLIAVEGRLCARVHLIRCPPRSFATCSDCRGRSDLVNDLSDQNLPQRGRTRGDPAPS